MIDSMYTSGEQLVTAWVKYVSVFLCYFEEEVFRERKSNYYRKLRRRWSQYVFQQSEVVERVGDSSKFQLVIPNAEIAQSARNLDSWKKRFLNLSVEDLSLDENPPTVPIIFRQEVPALEEVPLPSPVSRRRKLNRVRSRFRSVSSGASAFCEPLVRFLSRLQIRSN